LPSLHAVPSGWFETGHMPVVGSQAATVVHDVGMGHTTGFLPVQTPAVQVSVRVQALPSLQTVPSGFAGYQHIPVTALQVPASWHWSLAAQITGFPPVHTPLWHVSVWVQALPSLHAVPSGWFETGHTPVVGSQAATVVHDVGMGHTTGFLPVQTPAVQVSVWVQALPSLQAVPSGFAG